MNKLLRIARTPREHFMRAVEEEFSKFEHKEREFRRADRAERAGKLRLPIDYDRPSVHADERT